MRRRRDWAGKDPFNEPVEPGELPELDLADVDGIAFGNLSLPIVRHADGRVFFGDRFVLSATGVLIANEVTQSELWAFYAGAKKLTIAIKWVIGDLFFYAENRFSLSYGQIAERTGYTVRSVEQYIYVMRNISTRVESLTFRHHMIVAPLTDEDQMYWLEQAEAQGWSARKMERQIKGDALPETVSILTDKTNRLRVNRVWRNVQRGTLDRIKDDDIPLLIAWLKEVEERRKP